MTFRKWYFDDEIEELAFNFLAKNKVDKFDF